MNKKEFRELFMEKYPEGRIVSIRQSKKYNYFVVKALVDGLQYGCEDFFSESAYDPGCIYIGNKKDALHLTKKRGIKHFEKREDGNCVVSIGFNPDEQKWYGWSHRAICGFGIGSEVKKGDCAYQASNELDFIEDCVAFWDEPYKEEVLSYIEHRTDEENGEEQRGVTVSWRYSTDPEAIANEQLRGTVNGIFTPFPEVFGRGEWKAETLEDAKQMAIDFAEDVS